MEFSEQGWKTIKETVISGHVEMPNESNITIDSISLLQSSGMPAFDISYNVE